MRTEEGPLQLLLRITDPSVEIGQHSLQLARVDSPGEVEADFEVVEPVVKMPHIQIVLISQVSRQRSCKVSIDSQSVIKRADLRQIHRCYIDIEHLPHPSKKRLICDDHLIIDELLIIDVFLDKRVPILAISHHNTVLDLDNEWKVTFRQSIVGLLRICLVSKGREMIFLRYLDQFRSVSKRVKSVELASRAFQGSVDIRGDDLNGVVSVLISEKLEIVDVIFPQHLSKILMLSHAN